MLATTWVCQSCTVVHIPCFKLLVILSSMYTDVEEIYKKQILVTTKILDWKKKDNIIHTHIPGWFSVIPTAGIKHGA